MLCPSSACSIKSTLQVCSTAYTDADGERKFLPQYFRFSVANPVAVRTKVRNLPGGATLLEVGLENARKEPLTVTDVRFEPAPHLTVVPIHAPPIAAATARKLEHGSGSSGGGGSGRGAGGAGGAAEGGAGAGEGDGGEGSTGRAATEPSSAGGEGGSAEGSVAGLGPLSSLMAALHPLRANGGAEPHQPSSISAPPLHLPALRVHFLATCLLAFNPHHAAPSVSSLLLFYTHQTLK